MPGGLVLALGGYRALSQTASQADIIMHSRIFYYARIRGVTILYTPYRNWLRAQVADAPDSTRIWEWELLQALCNHRDRIAGSSSDEARASAAVEKDAWVRQLLGEELPAPTNGHDDDDVDGGDDDSSKPAWMAAAPRAELYVDRPESADDENGAEGQVPYPKKFADIIKAVQSGEPIDGIVDIPDIVARNPTTTPFGKLDRPRKPWEKDESMSGAAVEERSGLEGNLLDPSFPDPEETAGGTNQEIEHR
ncbi:hypothetical protein N0V82_001894 [Gnomoniopsis sp. IMI 355080]|nr:hypothetical protein N0V82_001894 [Gnomoniopsis sp. IMI 355080]